MSKLERNFDALDSANNANSSNSSSVHSSLPSFASDSNALSSSSSSAFLLADSNGFATQPFYQLGDGQSMLFGNNLAGAAKLGNPYNSFVDNNGQDLAMMAQDLLNESQRYNENGYDDAHLGADAFGGAPSRHGFGMTNGSGGVDSSTFDVYNGGSFVPISSTAPTIAVEAPIAAQNTSSQLTQSGGALDVNGVEPKSRQATTTTTTTTSKKASPTKAGKSKNAASGGSTTPRKRKKADTGAAEGEETGEKAKKKHKTQFQRRNIKKIISEKKLNDATLKALQEEQERQKRLTDESQAAAALADALPADYSLPNLIQSDIPSGNTGNGVGVGMEQLFGPSETGQTGLLPAGQLETSLNTSIGLNQSYPSIVEEPAQDKSDQSVYVIDDDDDENDVIKLNSGGGEQKQSLFTTPCQAPRPSYASTSASQPYPTGRLYNNNNNNSSQRYDGSGGGHLPFASSKCEVPTIELDDDEDDCKIISVSEHASSTTPRTSKRRGMHMNDKLNVPDQNGQVLINVNHPADEMDVYLLPYLAKNVKPHQIGGIRFMYDNIVESLKRVKEKSNGFGCILAHAMGLGKTLQVISFCEVFLRCTTSKRVMCIVPINTIQNWQSEFNNWLPENGQHRLDNDTIINYQRPFKLHMINDAAKTFKQRADIILDWRSKGGVLLIGYEMFRTLVTSKNPSQTQSNKQKKQAAAVAAAADATELIDLEEEDRNQNLQNEVQETLLTPCLVVCDEGHRIKNSSANIAKTLQTIKTKRRIVLTGYPLQNNLIEYWCMVDFVRPNYLGTKSEFTNMFERPIMNGQCIDSTKEDVKLMRYRAHVLHSLLEGFVQRRGHDVFLSTLPKKYEYIILLKLSSIQREIYLAFMEAIGAMNSNERSNPLRSFAICCKIWNHPDVLHRFYVNKESDMDLDLPELQTQTNAGKKQTARSSNQPSPAVIQINSGNSAYVMEDTGFNPFAAAFNDSKSGGGKAAFDVNWANKLMESYRANILENGAKFLVAFTIIEHSIMVGDKILLFSQSLLTLNLIEDYLHQMKVPNTNERWQKNKNYFRLDGSTSGMDREKLINAFNKPDNGVWLFLLSTRAGCLGINLIGANRVIVLDVSWNPCHDAQAVCRVFRYGQTKNCFIYRLIADHTMEKKIYDRQISKQTMSDRVIDEIQSENHFTRTEVEKLIHFVKEEVPPADLSDMPNKYGDQVLVSSCMKHANVITKEPFTHESLLIDKKEYQLSELEKEMALKEYQYDKRYFPYTKQGSLLYHQRLSFAENPCLSQFHSSLSSQSFAATSSSAYPYGLAASRAASSSRSGLGTPLSSSSKDSLDFSLHKSASSGSLIDKLTISNPSRNNNNENYHNSMTPTLMKCLNSSSLLEKIASPGSSKSSPQSQATYSSNGNAGQSNTACTDDFYITGSFPAKPSDGGFNGVPSQQAQMSQNGVGQQTQQSQSPNLRDVKISKFVTTTPIVIPANSSWIAAPSSGLPPGTTETAGSGLVIPAGENVVFLKTPKGCYLRTPDGKYIAIRTRSLLESVFASSAADRGNLMRSPNSSNSILGSPMNYSLNQPNQQSQQQAQQDQSNQYNSYNQLNATNQQISTNTPIANNACNSNQFALNSFTVNSASNGQDVNQEQQLQQQQQQQQQQQHYGGESSNYNQQYTTYQSAQPMPAQNQLNQVEYSHDQNNFHAQNNSSYTVDTTQTSENMCFNSQNQSNGGNFINGQYSSNDYQPQHQQDLFADNGFMNVGGEAASHQLTNPMNGSNL